MFNKLLALTVVGVATVHALPKKDFETFEQFTFTQRQDHFDTKNHNTFQQRYWKSNKYASEKDTPVFVYICGEGECHAPSDRSFYMDMADEFKA